MVFSSSPSSLSTGLLNVRLQGLIDCYNCVCTAVQFTCIKLSLICNKRLIYDIMYYVRMFQVCSKHWMLTHGVKYLIRKTHTTVKGFIFFKFVEINSAIYVIRGAAWGGSAARPAAAIVNSPVCARTRLPLTSAQFIKMTEVRHEKA